MTRTHKLVAAAALMAASLGHAQSTASAPSTVTLYGSIDQYLNHMSSSSGKSLTSLNDGAMFRSRLGVRGSEDLGSGLSARFQLEHGLYADSGKQNDGTRFFDRQAWVGLATPYGEFRVGRQNTALFYRNEYIDYSGRTLGSTSNHFGLPARLDNDLAYIAPRWNGLLLEAHFAPGEQASGGSLSKGVWQLAADYLDGPYRVGYAGLRARPPAGAAVNTTIGFDNVYANYDYGQGKVYASGIRSNNNTASSAGLFGNNAGGILGSTGALVAGTDARANQYHNVLALSADYRVSKAWRVGAQVARIRDTSGGGQNARGESVGAFYELSKRTSLYSMFETLRNAPSAGFVMAGSAAVLPNFDAADVNGQRLRAVQLGIVHRF